MAKTSSIQRNNKRKRLVAKYLKLRNELRELVRKPSTPDGEREAAQMKLASLPRNSNPNRIRNRCELTGRPRGYYSKFGLGRSKLRERALAGQLPGVKKASW